MGLIEIKRETRVSTLKIEAPTAKYICPGCGRTQSFGVRIGHHMTMGADNVLRACSGVDSLPVPSEIPSAHK